METLFLRGMLGLGDNFYQYPVIKELSKFNRVFLKTPWPQIYEDLENVICIPLMCNLRMQKKNAWRFRNDDSIRVGEIANYQKLSYTNRRYTGDPIWKCLCDSANLDHLSYWLGEERHPTTKNLAVIRPATIRKEWRSPSRNPKQEYIQYAVDFLKGKGKRVVVVASLEEHEEWWDGEAIKNADEYLVSGELNFEEIWNLFASVEIVVSPVGFAAPMGMFNSVPTVIIHGGCGGLNHPELIDAPTDQPLIHVLPKTYCMCSNNCCFVCDKTIDLEEVENGIEAALAR